MLRPAPDISVITPVHNRRELLRQSVMSALGPGREVIVVDDGSTDGSLDVVSDLPCLRLRTARRHGAAAARNLGLRVARGRYLAFLDSDDILLETGLEARAAHLRQSGAAAVMGRVGDLIDETGDSLGTPESALRRAYRLPSLLKLDYFRHPENRGPFNPLGLTLFRRETIRRLGPLDERLRVLHDYDYLFRLLADTPLPFLDVPVVRYRLHSGNLSGRRAPNDFVLTPAARAEWLFVQWEHFRRWA
jgi:glycosyltransferase involved in cell wall biosynthesis